MQKKQPEKLRLYLIRWYLGMWKDRKGRTGPGSKQKGHKRFQLSVACGKGCASLKRTSPVRLSATIRAGIKIS